ncbi:hypothetical protein [Bradyrhizobium sp. AS23.2]|uniref:hypothetical protein n=1 Tax=Bradyrhizobium sp. AS23.2 TaxID=1680155 RepID=UPI00093A1B29|nr:hypothetical protein [Bradyrhizobium sp. AS23.2]OKO85989.1 hypothetical protein AC630_04555 [Bradyrhizobium sp. AS23.2]
MTSKIHAVVDSNGLPVRLALSPRRGETRYDRLAANYLAFVQLASIRLWLRLHKSAAWNLPRCEAAAMPALTKTLHRHAMDGAG